MVFERETIKHGEPDEEEQTPIEEDAEEDGADEEDEEMADPLETIRQKCEQTAHCMHAQERLEACETRVGSRSRTEEDCTEFAQSLTFYMHGTTVLHKSSSVRLNEAPLRHYSFIPVEYLSCRCAFKSTEA